jgi:ssDNA thymidine ADP-ribosyltransferase, DarT
VFTDRHAYLEAASFSSDLAKLDRVDWRGLQARDFKKDPDDPAKFEKYQAEALIHRMMPTRAFLGLSCYTDSVASAIGRMLIERGLRLKVVVKPGWYF